MKIYKVTTEGDAEGKTTKSLGYAQGDRQDIIDFFSPQKYYEIHLEEITIQNITPALAYRSKELNEEKIQIENRLKEINVMLTGK
ncbi:hypothetical protein [Chryseobacterium lathyri]|uniref:hypothetical protein n=1 Tax=Chryseobacterium lathyri TaxID=395933 RepID=UPI001CBDA50C|nr:hypothetical protein [Chryseobacterium lathyri]